MSMVSCLTLAGCVHRSLTIRSEPPGAEILVNDTPVGTTPYAYDFMWYGWYRITLTKPGYERIDARERIRCPVYLWMPFDLAMEVLPVPIRDTTVLSYQLRPQVPLPEPAPPPMEMEIEPPAESREPAPTPEAAPGDNTAR